ncbi:HHR191Wp [Eremothecium sinecaudum]|uniref:HHR191Wp n=1 Tax=Eremothecium sinecaudum TaxID=45286 RepID=A0A0X8HWW7_9SACH|nr:HHR191Wp [Eremothecium sinecaudum]AMD22960.1 HHR191Wp [Eremothecium sinecaudum]
MSQFIYPQEVSPFIGTFSSYPWVLPDKGVSHTGLDFQYLNDLHDEMASFVETDCTSSVGSHSCQSNKISTIGPGSTIADSLHESSPEYSASIPLLTSRSSSSCSMKSSGFDDCEPHALNDPLEVSEQHENEHSKGEFTENILKYPPILPSQTSSNRRLIFVSKICPLCGKCFTRRSTLQIHLLIHTNLKPFKCSFCDKEFNVKSNLNRHERIHRQKKVASSYPSSDQATRNFSNTRSITRSHMSAKKKSTAPAASRDSERCGVYSGTIEK